MKKILISLIALAFVGCAGTSPIVTNVTIVMASQNQKFVAFVKIAQGILAIGGKAAIQYAVSPQDAVQIKALLSGSGHVFESLENGTVPSDSDIQDSLHAYFPTTSGKYIPVENLAAQAWGYILPLIQQFAPQNNTTMYLQYVNYVLNALAQTAYQVGGS